MVTVRPATPGDLEALLDIMWTEPSRDAVVFAGDAVRARRFGSHLLEHALSTSPVDVHVAEDDGHPVGFVQTTGTGSDAPPARVLISAALRSFGWKLPTVVLRARTRARVDLEAPPGATHIVEVQVHPSHRGSGIGGHLLRDVEARARAAQVATLSLTTTITNPARRLYERHGFVVLTEVVDRGYEELTGAPGRVLMAKVLADPPAT
jgi:ribosomal protein S18 acetylase RimI-like enzyme